MTDWSLRPVDEALRRRYLAEGLWTDDTFGAALDAHLRRNADREVRIWSAARPSRSTAGQVHERARRLAGGLGAHGVEAGHVVAFQLPNWEEAVVTLTALALLGAVAVPVVSFYGPRELEFIVTQSGATTLVTADRFGRLDYLAGLEDIRPTLTRLEHVVVLRTGAAPLPPGVLDFADTADVAPLPAPAAVGPDEPAVVAYTSGTTADPKGVVHTHRSLLAEVRQLATIQYPTHRPTLHGAPVAHAIGMLGGVLLPLHLGLGIHLTDGWDPPSVLAAMLEADLTAGSGSTVFLLSLLDAEEFSAEHAAKMEWVGLGAAPVPSAVAERAEALGIRVTRVYGATEHPSITGSHYDAPRHLRNGTDGEPLAGVEVRLVDDDGRPVDRGTPGEILSRGPDLFAGYTDPALTAAAVDADGWYATGDIGVLDEHGYLTITDRKSDIIIRGGANLSAAEIENVIARMPEVTELAVVAAPDDRLGERACAVLRLRPGSPAPDLAAVQRHCETQGLVRQKWPELIRIVEDLPRTPSGKIKKYTLRDEMRSTR